MFGIRSTPKHTNYRAVLITVCLCLCLHVAGRCDAVSLCELNIRVPTMTPLCQKLCAQLVSSGALCPKKQAKNEHLEMDPSLSVPVAQGNVTFKCRITYIPHHIYVQGHHRTKEKVSFGCDVFRSFR